MLRNIKSTEGKNSYRYTKSTHMLLSELALTARLIIGAKTIAHDAPSPFRRCSRKGAEEAAPLRLTRHAFAGAESDALQDYCEPKE